MSYLIASDSEYLRQRISEFDRAYRALEQIEALEVELDDKQEEIVNMLKLNIESFEGFVERGLSDNITTSDLHSVMQSLEFNAKIHAVELIFKELDTSSEE